MAGSERALRARKPRFQRGRHRRDGTLSREVKQKMELFRSFQTAKCPLCHRTNVGGAKTAL